MLSLLKVLGVWLLKLLIPDASAAPQVPLKVIQRLSILQKHGSQIPTLIILHDTAGPTLSSAENTLRYERKGGLGYHFMIDKDGTVYQYGKPSEVMYHAANFNKGTVSISFVGGYKYGPVSQLQIEVCIRLINDIIKPITRSIRYITCHKHASFNGKVDPRFPGEPPEGINLKIDEMFMRDISQKVNLEFIGHGTMLKKRY